MQKNRGVISHTAVFLWKNKNLPFSYWLLVICC